jgi:hypothetical protein
LFNLKLKHELSFINFPRRVASQLCCKGRCCERTVVRCSRWQPTGSGLDAELCESSNSALRGLNVVGFTTEYLLPFLAVYEGGRGGAATEAQAQPSCCKNIITKLPKMYTSVTFIILHNINGKMIFVDICLLCTFNII